MAAVAFAFARAFLYATQLPRLPIWLRNCSFLLLLYAPLSVRSLTLSLALWIQYGALGVFLFFFCVVRSTPAARRMLNGNAGDNGFYTPDEQAAADSKRQLRRTKNRSATNQRSAHRSAYFSLEFVSFRREKLDATGIAVAVGSGSGSAARRLGLAWMALLAWLPLVRLAFSICPCWQRHRQRQQQRHHCTVVRISFAYGQLKSCAEISKKVMAKQIIEAYFSAQSSSNS